MFSLEEMCHCETCRLEPDRRAVRACFRLEIENAKGKSLLLFPGTIERAGNFAHEAHGLNLDSQEAN